MGGGGKTEMMDTGRKSVTGTYDPSGRKSRIPAAYPVTMLADLQVYVVPREKWVLSRRLYRHNIVEDGISLGFVRVLPQLSIHNLRRELQLQLGPDVIPRDFIFIRAVGNIFIQLKPKQEIELKVKNFIPPFSNEPEIYLLEVLPNEDPRLISPLPLLLREDTPPHLCHDLCHHSLARKMKRDPESPQPTTPFPPLSSTSSSFESPCTTSEYHHILEEYHRTVKHDKHGSHSGVNIAARQAAYDYGDDFETPVNSPTKSASHERSESISETEEYEEIRSEVSKRATERDSPSSPDTVRTVIRSKSKSVAQDSLGEVHEFTEFKIPRDASRKNSTAESFHETDHETEQQNFEHRESNERHKTSSQSEPQFKEYSSEESIRMKSEEINTSRNDGAQSTELTDNHGILEELIIIKEQHPSDGNPDIIITTQQDASATTEEGEAETETKHVEIQSHTNEEYGREDREKGQPVSNVIGRSETEAETSHQEQVDFHQAEQTDIESQILQEITTNDEPNQSVAAITEPQQAARPVLRRQSRQTFSPEVLKEAESLESESNSMTKTNRDNSHKDEEKEKLVRGMSEEIQVGIGESTAKDGTRELGQPEKTGETQRGLSQGKYSSDSATTTSHTPEGIIKRKESTAGPHEERRESLGDDHQQIVQRENFADPTGTHSKHDGESTSDTHQKRKRSIIQSQGSTRGSSDDQNEEKETELKQHTIIESKDRRESIVEPQKIRRERSVEVESPQKRRERFAEHPQVRHESTVESPQKRGDSTVEQPQVRRESIADHTQVRRESSVESPRERKENTVQPQVRQESIVEYPEVRRESSVESPQKREGTAKHPQVRRESTDEHPQVRRESIDHPQVRRESSLESPQKRESSAEHPQVRRESTDHPQLRRQSTADHPQVHRENTTEHPQVRRESTTEHPQSRRESTTDHQQVRRESTAEQLQTRRESTAEQLQTRRESTTEHPQTRRESTAEHPQSRRESTTDHQQVRRESTAEHPQSRRESTTDHQQVRRESTAEQPQSRRESTAEHPQTRRESTTEHPQVRRESTAEEPQVRRESTPPQMRRESIVQPSKNSGQSSVDSQDGQGSKTNNIKNRGESTAESKNRRESIVDPGKHKKESTVEMAESSQKRQGNIDESQYERGESTDGTHQEIQQTEGGTNSSDKYYRTSVESPPSTFEISKQGSHDPELEGREIPTGESLVGRDNLHKNEGSRPAETTQHDVQKTAGDQSRRESKIDHGIVTGTSGSHQGGTRDARKVGSSDEETRTKGSPGAKSKATSTKKVETKAVPSHSSHQNGKNRDRTQKPQGASSKSPPKKQSPPVIRNIPINYQFNNSTTHRDETSSSKEKVDRNGSQKAETGAELPEGQKQAKQSKTSERNRKPAYPHRMTKTTIARQALAREKRRAYVEEMIQSYMRSSHYSSASELHEAIAIGNMQDQSIQDHLMYRRKCHQEDLGGENSNAHPNATGRLAKVNPETVQSLPDINSYHHYSFSSKKRHRVPFSYHIEEDSAPPQTISAISIIKPPSHVSKPQGINTSHSNNSSDNQKSPNGLKSDGSPNSGIYVDHNPESTSNFWKNVSEQGYYYSFRVRQSGTVQMIDKSVQTGEQPQSYILDFSRQPNGRYHLHNSRPVNLGNNGTQLPPISRDKILRDITETVQLRHDAELRRGELIQRANDLQSLVKEKREKINRRHEFWHKKYIEESSMTRPLEGACNSLRSELNTVHRRLIAHLEGRDLPLRLRDGPSKKANYKIMAARLQHEIKELQQKAKAAKLRLESEVKLKEQSEREVRDIRNDLAHKKVVMSLAKSQLPPAYHPRAYDALVY